MHKFLLTSKQLIFLSWAYGFINLSPSVLQFTHPRRAKKDYEKGLREWKEVWNIWIFSSSLQHVFERSHNLHTRGHVLKLHKRRVHTLHQHFFTERVINIWNMYDEETVAVNSVNSFKGWVIYKTCQVCVTQWAEPDSWGSPKW